MSCDEEDFVLIKNQRAMVQLRLSIDVMLNTFPLQPAGDAPLCLNHVTCRAALDWIIQLYFSRDVENRTRPAYKSAN